MTAKESVCYFKGKRGSIINIEYFPGMVFLVSNVYSLNRIYKGFEENYNDCMLTKIEIEATPYFLTRFSKYQMNAHTFAKYVEFAND